MKVFYDIGKILLALKKEYRSIYHFLEENKKFNQKAIFKLFSGNPVKPFANPELIKEMCILFSMDFDSIQSVALFERKSKKQKRIEELERAKENNKQI